MRTLLFTGSGGAGASTAATASALLTARDGRRTLLLSVGPTHSLSTLLNTPLNDEPYSAAPNLDVLQVDIGNSITRYYQRVRAMLPAAGPQLSPDELPLVAGFDLFFALLRLRELAPHYELAVLDGGACGALLRALSTPDAARWGLRLLLGLDREPGQDPRSALQALLPSALLPPQQLDSVQNTRVEIEQLRDLLTPAQGASIRWALRPDGVGLAEARLAIPVLQLHGALVEALIVAPGIPDQIADPRLESVRQQRQAATSEARQIWPARPLLTLPWTPEPVGIEGLTMIGQTLYDGGTPDAWLLEDTPVAESHDGQPALVLRLPGMPREALGLTLSGDELIVRVGPYRRHVLLPTGLRGISAIKASREGETLIVRARG